MISLAALSLARDFVSLLFLSLSLSLSAAGFDECIFMDAALYIHALA